MHVAVMVAFFTVSAEKQAEFGVKLLRNFKNEDTPFQLVCIVVCSVVAVVVVVVAIVVVAVVIIVVVVGVVVVVFVVINIVQT